MAYELREGSGSLFKNDKKTSDNHPDYKGDALVDGVPRYLDAWIKTAKSGQKFMSVSIKPKQQAASAAAPQRTPAARLEDMDDDITF